MNKILVVTNFLSLALLGLLLLGPNQETSYKTSSVYSPLSLSLKVDSSLSKADLIKTTVERFYEAAETSNIKINPVICQASPIGPVCKTYNTVEIKAIDNLPPNILSLLDDSTPGVMKMLYNRSMVEGMNPEELTYLILHDMSSRSVVVPPPVAHQPNDFI